MTGAPGRDAPPERAGRKAATEKAATEKAATEKAEAEKAEADEAARRATRQAADAAQKVTTKKDKDDGKGKGR